MKKWELEGRRVLGGAGGQVPQEGTRAYENEGPESCLVRSFLFR